MSCFKQDSSYFVLLGRPKRKSEPSLEMSLDTMASYLNSKLDTQPEDSDFAFGRLIGLELGKINDESMKKNMKRKILNIVFGGPDEEQCRIKTLEALVHSKK